MKSKILLDTLELIVTSKENRVESFSGDETIETLVKDYFDKPIDVVTSGKEDKKLGMNSSKSKTLNPGDKDYIMAALIEIRNDLDLRTEHNIKEIKNEKEMS